MAANSSGTVGVQPSARVAAIWLCSLVAIMALWVAGVLVPYYVNDLDRLPLNELSSSGDYDPKDLWPYAGGSSAASLRGVLLPLVPLLPLMGLGSAVAGAAILIGRREGLTAAARRLTVAALVLAALMVAVSLSPFGLALRTWVLD